MRLLAFMFALIAVPAVAQEARTAAGGVIRVLDKITGEVQDIEMRNGETRRVGHLQITLGECRYPANNPSGDAYELLAITYRDNPEPLFQGWMVASAPAISALEHPRYDVWALRCMIS